MNILLPLLALAVGFLVAWLLTKSRNAALRQSNTMLESQLKQQQTDAEARLQVQTAIAEQQKQEMLSQQKAHYDQQFQAQKDDHEARKQDWKEQLRIEQEQRQEQLIQQKQDHDKQFQALKQDHEAQKKEWKEQLRTEFENISHKLLKEQEATFSAKSGQRVGELLKPLQDNLKDFKETINTTIRDKETSLEAQIKNVIESSRQIGNDANKLAQALRSNSKVQGDWGEMILEQILENSGLTRGTNYEVQPSVSDEETQERRRPDVVVHYPGERDMIIDSKVSLTAYAEYINDHDNSDSSKDDALSRHALSVRNHVIELSRKDYSKLYPKSPDFVILFMPIEQAYLLAMQADPGLWEFAYTKKIVLMSPTNLITALRLAYDLWTREAQTRNIEEIIRRGTSLYEKVVGFVETFETVGASISKANEHYEKAKNQLTTGNGNVLRQIEQLKKLGLTPKKQLPTALLLTDDDDQLNEDSLLTEDTTHEAIPEKTSHNPPDDKARKQSTE